MMPRHFRCKARLQPQSSSLEHKTNYIAHRNKKRKFIEVLI